MKTILFFCLAFLATSSFAQSSTGSDAYIRVTYLGYNNGQYAIKVDNMQSGCNPDVSFAWNSGTVMSAVSPNPKNNVTQNTVTGAATTFYFTGAFNQAAKVTVKDLSICQWLGSSPVEVSVSVSGLVTTPIVLNYFRYSAGSFEWQTAQEVNTDRFQVERQADGSASWLPVGVVTAAGNSSTASNYTLAFSGVTTAGFGLFGLLLFVGGFIKNRKHFALVLLVSAVGVVSCTKSTPKPSGLSASGSYRLVEVDKDGVETYSQIIHL